MSIYQDRTKKYIGIATTSSNAGGTITIPINGTVTAGGNNSYHWYDPNWNNLYSTGVGSGTGLNIQPIIPGSNIHYELTEKIYYVKKSQKLNIHDWIKKNQLIKEGKIKEID